MTVAAFEGPAGCGKTHRLMDELANHLEKHPLTGHERVMALTFMHGSRRRLDGRLREVPALAGRYEASTLDSFAWRLVQRWHRLAIHLGYSIPAEIEYGRTCALAAALLQKEHVRAWVQVCCPLVLVDEAQDLSRERSAIIEALARSGHVMLAFDEFQCLDTELLPITIEEWLRNYCEPLTLQGCRRTNNAELIEAAHAVRDGRAVNLGGRSFKVQVTQSIPLCAAWIAGAISFRNGRGTFAVLTPSRRGGFAEDAIARVAAGPVRVGQRNVGPYAIGWESNEEHEFVALWERLGIANRCTAEEALVLTSRHRHERDINSMREWIIRQRSTRGITEFSAEELRCQLNRARSLQRRYSQRRKVQFSAMTIPQAKNREFDHVIVVWPYTVQKDEERRRRLLYNAITRAKYSCTILVQNANMLTSPPFVPGALQAGGPT